MEGKEIHKEAGEHPEEIILEMKNISKHFGMVKALENVSFNVKKGQVHILVGENGAGKSTLIKILNGIELADQGEIIFERRLVESHAPKDMLKLGIATIHQELSPVYEMTIAENIFMGRELVTPFGNVDVGRMNSKAKDIITELGFKYKPTMKMSELSVSDMQIIEIVKAISREAKLIIMDEPTSSITGSEVEVLFRQIRKLKQKGVAFIYITHKMEEVFQIGDEATVLRDGEVVESRKITEWNDRELILQMVGREINDVYPKRKCKLGEVKLSVEGLSKKNTFTDISFKVKSGEVVGFAGLVGAGRTDVFKAIFGLSAYDSGTVRINGKLVEIKTVRDAIKNSMAMIPEDRKREGLVLCRSVEENIALPNLDFWTKSGYIQKGAEIKDVLKMTEVLQIKLASIYSDVVHLSGGNQQKVVLAKWILRDVNILIFDEPTRGIDMGAKYEIYKLINKFAENGVAIVMISSELPELIGMCDRIIVMEEGKIQGEIAKEDFTQEDIMTMATGGKLA